MLGSCLIAERPLARKDQFTIAEMQAKTARTVGTHIGSPLHLLGMETLAADVLPRMRVARALAELSRKSPLDLRKIASELTRKAPETTRESIDDVRVTGAVIFGYGAMQIVSLGLSHPTLDKEAVEMNFALDKVTGISPPIWQQQYMSIAQVGAEHADDVKASLNQWIRETEPVISLNPLLPVRRLINLPLAS